MTAGSASLAGPPRRIGRSIWAVVAGFLLVLALSLGTDEVLHLFRVYPPWGQPMFEPGLNALALGYRLIFDTLGSWLTARLAPRAPMGHALIGGGIGFVLSLLGVFAATRQALGPLWYPVALAASALPTAWLGGWLALRQHARR